MLSVLFPTETFTLKLHASIKRRTSEAMDEALENWDDLPREVFENTAMAIKYGFYSIAHAANCDLLI